MAFYSNIFALTTISTLTTPIIASTMATLSFSSTRSTTSLLKMSNATLQATSGHQDWAERVYTVAACTDPSNKARSWAFEIIPSVEREGER